MLEEERHVPIWCKMDRYKLRDCNGRSDTQSLTAIQENLTSSVDSVPRVTYSGQLAGRLCTQKLDARTSLVSDRKWSDQQHLVKLLGLVCSFRFSVFIDFSDNVCSECYLPDVVPNGTYKNVLEVASATRLPESGVFFCWNDVKFDSDRLKS